MHDLASFPPTRLAILWPCAVNCMNATNYGEIIIHHINHSLRGGVARVAMSRARFSRRNSIRNAHLLSVTQRNGYPIVLTYLRALIRFQASPAPPDICDPWIPLRGRKFLASTKGPKYPVHMWRAVLFKFLYLASFVLLRPGCVDVRDSCQRTLGARRHAPFVHSRAFWEARAPHANGFSRKLIVHMNHIT